MQGNLRLPCVPIAQQAFFFVAPEQRQLMADNYEEQERRNRRRFVRYQTHLQQKIRVEVLDQPLFTLEGQQTFESFTCDPLEAADEAELLEACDELACSEKERQEIIAYFAERPQQFVGYVLDRAFDALACIGNAKEKAHILEWMFAADILGHVVETVEEKFGDQVYTAEISRPIFSVDEPMTFQWCCKVFGLRPDVYQEQILDNLKRAEAETRFRETKGELRPGRHKTFRDAFEFASNL